MKVLPEEEFRALAIEQGFDNVELMTGFIDKETSEAVVLQGTTPHVKVHELGHEELEHFPKAIKFYGRGKKDIYQVTEPWTTLIDDEIEAEIFSFENRGKKITPRVGLIAIRELIVKEWEVYPAVSLVIGRMRNYGIETSLKERRDLVGILEREMGVEMEWKL